ncbi:MAG: VOC family protein, partial [Candidatus Binatia bacterium]
MASSTDLPAIDLPPLDQIAYMVHDLEEAVRRFTPMFGPFTTMEADNKGALYKGQPHDVDLKIAFGRSGDIEVELIEHVRGESPHKDWIEAHG